MIAFAKYMQKSCPDFYDQEDLLMLSKFIETRLHLEKESFSALRLQSAEGAMAAAADWTAEAWASCGRPLQDYHEIG